MASDGGCDTSNALLSLLALSHQAALDDPMEKAKEDLEALGITDEDIQALVDEELTPEEQYRLQDIFLFYPALQARYEELKKQKDQLKMWWSVLNNRH